MVWNEEVFFEALSKGWGPHRTSGFPALGRAVRMEYCTHSKDLSAQKMSLSAPAAGKYRSRH